MPKHAEAENDIHPITTIEMDESVHGSTSPPNVRMAQHPDSLTSPTAFVSYKSRKQQLSPQQRWELPRLRPFFKSPQRSPSGGGDNKKNNSGDNNNSDSDGGPPNRPHTAGASPRSPPLKPPLESQDTQLVCYKALRSCGFASLHEELQHLRLSHTQMRRTLSLRNEEIKRLQKQATDRAGEIARLQALVEMFTKRQRRAPLSNSLEYTAAEEKNRLGSLPLSSPSLSLFAATKDSAVPGKILLELRQNVAMRDTIIDGLRVELLTLRKECREAAEGLSRATAELTAKDSLIKGLQQSTPQEESATSAASAAVAAANTTIAELQRQLRRVKDERPTTATGSSTAQRIQQQEEPTQSKQQQQQQQQQYIEQGSELERLRRELSESRRALDRERDSSAEAARQWRRETAQLQGTIAAAGFADARLHAAQHENDTLQQRVRELRDEAVASATREREMRTELRSLREAHERREEEVASLERRLTLSRETERSLRSDVEALEGRLAGVQKSEGSSAQESYTALMTLYAAQQERLVELEEKLHRAHAEEKAECTSAVQVRAEGAHTEEKGTSGVARLADDVAAMQATLRQVQAQLHATSTGTGTMNEVRSVRDIDVSSVAMMDASVGPVMNEPLSATGSVHCVSDFILCDPPESIERRRNGVRERLQEAQRHAETQWEQREGKEEEEEYIGGGGGGGRERLKSQEGGANVSLTIELKRTRHLLSACEEELRTARRQIAAFEQLMRGVGERKMSSLRAAREEAALWRRMVEERDAELSACEARRRAEDDAIENALRVEMARVDEEMNALRRERDAWKAAAVVQNQ